MLIVGHKIWVLSYLRRGAVQVGVKTLFEPILGLGTSYQFVKAAVDGVERQKRIATLASFFEASGSAPATPLKSVTERW